MSSPLFRSRRAAIALIAFATLSCHDVTRPITNDASTASRALSPSARPQLSLDPTQLLPVFGPQTVTRSTGKPVTESFTVAGFGPDAVLHVVNGDAAGNNRVSSGSITIDGREVVGPSAFSQVESTGQHAGEELVATIDMPLQIQNPATIQVRLAGKPGSQLTITIDARLATSASVTPNGGIIRLLGSQVILTIPAGALQSTTVLTADPINPPAPGVIPGTSINFGPTGTTFAVPITLSIAYDPAALPRGVKPSYLHLMWWNVDHWEQLPGNAVDAAHASVSATTTHFGTFALLPDAVEFCPTDPTAESDFPTAVSDTPIHGTLWVCDGQFTVAGTLNKPMTLGAEHRGHATLAQASTAAAGDAVVLIAGVPSGAVNVKDMGFLYVTGGIRTLDFGQLNVTGSTFTGTVLNNNSSGVFLASTPTPPGHVLFDHDTFVGGTFGLNQQQPVDIETYNSEFHDIGLFALIYSTANGVQNPVPPGGTAISRHGRVEHNTFTNCGRGVCIALEESGADTVRFNTISMPAGSVTDGIFIARGGVPANLTHPAVITDNVIGGHAPTGDPTLAASWGVKFGLRDLSFGLAGVIDDVERNVINTAFTGFDIRGPAAINATDNAVTNTLAVMNYVGAGSITAHRNDFTNYTYPIATNVGSVPFNPSGPSNVVAQSLTCNWWGNVSGPVGVFSSVPANSYIPFASGPIANSTTSCDPSATPTMVRVCPTPSGSSPTMPTFSQAYGLVAAGGTVMFCDGSFVIGNVQVQKPLTITAEGPGMPTIDAGGGSWVFVIGNVTPAGTVSLSRLRFTGGIWGNVFVGDNAGNVHVSSNEFHPPQTGPYGGAIGWLSGLQLGGKGIGTVNVDDNTFIGGDLGFHINSPSGSPTLRGNTFLNQNNSSIHVAGPRPGPIVIEKNTFRGCGPNWCLFTQHGVTTTGNTVEIPTGRPTFAPFRIDNFSGGTSVITDNAITGSITGTDRNLAASYSIPGRAMQVIGAGQIERNRITYAFNGIGASTAALTGRDNVIEHSYAPFAFGGGPSGSTISMTRNDLLDYVVTLQDPFGFAAVSLACNYWGSASGPTGITGSTSWYTPFSAVPIANQPTVVCP